MQRSLASIFDYLNDLFLFPQILLCIDYKEDILCHPYGISSPALLSLFTLQTYQRNLGGICPFLLTHIPLPL